MQSLCLQIKSLQLGSISQFLSRALQPPEPLSVNFKSSLLPKICSFSTAILLHSFHNAPMFFWFYGHCYFYVSSFNHVYNVGSKCCGILEGHWGFGWEWKSDFAGYENYTCTWAHTPGFIYVFLCCFKVLFMVNIHCDIAGRTQLVCASSWAKTWENAHIWGYFQLSGSNHDCCCWPECQRSISDAIWQEGCMYHLLFNNIYWLFYMF